MGLFKPNIVIDDRMNNKNKINFMAMRAILFMFKYDISKIKPKKHKETAMDLRIR